MLNLTIHPMRADALNLQLASREDGTTLVVGGNGTILNLASLYCLKMALETEIHRLEGE